MTDFLEFDLGGTVEINGIPYRRTNKMFALCNGAAPTSRSPNPAMWPGLSSFKKWHSSCCAQKDSLVDREYRENLFAVENHIGCPLCGGHLVVPRALDCPLNCDVKIRVTRKGFRIGYVPRV